ncbi:hypothetical protein AYO21_04318 [Fonsecaea monophora]|uniref:Xylanolytic transcriptional activator regulatory domain-containing protein n=1 Tax=Fonsecaea monophora TaxID=254056 RepID=A0A177FC53_9EURO|nr:hypothetical protein AYO21_04318 [Fonsecaea monophora]OAG41376.1 hypothetical protein AYO21_04318 [Fonsecaea monophora]
MTLSEEERQAQAARRRREKPQLSCNLCRKRNLLEPTTTRILDQSIPSDVKDRVKQLESQVEYLMGALSQDEPIPPTLEDNVLLIQDQTHQQDHYRQDPEPIVDSAGWLQISQGRDDYVGSAHWLAILQGIPALRNVFQNNTFLTNNEDDLNNRAAEEEPDLLGYCGKASREDILGAIPSKGFVDALMTVCFVNTDNEAMLVHPPTFQKEYDSFWENPTSVSTMWIGLLFALMCLAVQYQQFSSNEERRLQIADAQPERLVRLYRQKTIQCLVQGKYCQGPRYAVETMLLYLFIETLREGETKSLQGPWVLWGSLVRIAFRAGYHRDGSHWPTMSCFEAERRRRVWNMLVGWDMYLSIQFGLPRMINISLCDTADPRNLFEEDLDEDMLELPSPRPESSRTIGQFHVAKNQLLNIFGMVNDLTMSVKPSSYTEVLRLDKVLTSAYESIIPVWKSEPQAQDLPSLSQAPATISVRCTFLTFIYHRAQIVLHRKYMSLGRNQERYAHSRKVCIEAALAILRHQWALYLETRIGGQLCRHGWKFLSLLVQDFLFATAILCAELGEEISLASPSAAVDVQTSTAGWNGGGDTDLRDAVFHALSSSYIVWLQSDGSYSSQEIKTVVAALRHLLSRVQAIGSCPSRVSASRPSTSLPGTDPGIDELGHTQSQQRVGYGPEIDKPTSGDVYWGLGHFPI